MTHRRPRRGATLVLGAAVVFPLLPGLLAGSVADRFSGIETLKSVANLAAFLAVAAWRRISYLTATMAGLRQGELLALRWRDVDWVAGVLRVRRSYTRGALGAS